MFKYLDVPTQRVLSKMSDYALYKMTTGKGEDYPLFAEWMDSPLFWSELCTVRFDIKPYDPTIAKQLFQGEYLFTCKRYSEAAANGSYRALLHLHKVYLNQKNYAAAIKNDEELIKHYGLVGAIYCCQTYQLAVNDHEDELTYAQAAVDMLNKMELSVNSPLCAHYLKELGWEEDFKKQYTNTSTFIEMSRNFFDAHLSSQKSSCSI